MICAHLYDSYIVFCRQLEQCFWHADMVVQISLRIEHVIFLCQHSSNKLLGRCLAVSACYADDSCAELLAVMMCQLLQGV